MKIFQIVNGFCYYEMTKLYNNLEAAKKHYPPSLIIVEAPDYVFEGWGYNASNEGDARFTQPIPPEGWLYDENTGTFYSKDKLILDEIDELKNNLSSTDYQAIKYAEGWMSEEEYTPIKTQRQEWRDKINELEIKLNEN